MRTYPVRSVGFLLALGALGALACDQGMTDSAQHSRVVLDLRPVLGVLGGDFVSVLDTARLTITSDGQQQTMTSLFGTGDSETTFDVSLKSGPATFIFDAISTNGTPLYRGQATSTIDGDGFAVTITPQADTAVMVVYPRRPTFDTITVVYNDVDHPALRATLNVRNPGSATLNWHVASIPPLPTGFIAITCAVPSRQADCLRGCHLDGHDRRGHPCNLHNVDEHDIPSGPEHQVLLGRRGAHGGDGAFRSWDTLRRIS